MSGLSRNREEPPADEADLEWCHDAVQGVSRTFALTIEVLDEPMSTYICVGYLLCRVADTVEDASHIPPEEQATLLRCFDRVLDPSDETSVTEFESAIEEWLPPESERSEDWNVVAETRTVVHSFRAQPRSVRNAVRPPVRELVQGMVLFVERYADQGGLRLKDREELEEYCYYAAGTVGYLITNLVTRGEVESDTERTLYGTAESFGLLLQLVNIAKDVYVDFREENNVYLPATWLREAGVEQSELNDPEQHERVAAVVHRTADHARGFLDDAQQYLEEVPETDGNRLAAWAIPFLLAVGTLRELSTRPEDAATGEGVKISRQEVAAIVTAMAGERDRDALADLRRTISEEPFHHQLEGV